MKQPQKKKKHKWKRLLFLHRYVGLTAAFFAILLSVTGILLNHTEELRLHHRNVDSSWLMGLYGIQTPEVKTAYSVADNWIVELGHSVYFKQQELKCKTPLMGAMISSDDLIIIANREQLCLVTADGELVDYLQLNTGNEITRIGSSGEISLVETTKGLMTVNDDYTQLISIKQKQVQQRALENGQEKIWQASAIPPNSVITSLKKQYKGEGLPLERIILDLHSGRIMSKLGVYFMDLVAVLLIFLSFSGIIMWFKRAFKKK